MYQLISFFKALFKAILLYLSFGYKNFTDKINQKIDTQQTARGIMYWNGTVKYWLPIIANLGHNFHILISTNDLSFTTNAFHL